MQPVELKEHIIQEIQTMPMNLLEELSDYIASIKDQKGFERDKKMLHQVYQDVVDGKANLTPYMDGMDAIDQMIDEIENENHQR